MTTKAQKDISTIHDRMPVLIDKSEAEMWINLDNQFPEVKRELTKIKETLNYYQVSDFVSKPNNNSVECISPFKASNMPRLFEDD